MPTDFVRAPGLGEELYLNLDAKLADELATEFADAHPENPAIAERVKELLARGQRRLRVRVVNAPQQPLAEEDVVEVDEPELTGVRGDSPAVAAQYLSLPPA